ncbi:MAG: CAP domain-containing protein [Polyangiaceae bacterium]|nr:CAP domain-containing protein [Polyangiaceae bacterium]
MTVVMAEAACGSASRSSTPSARTASPGGPTETEATGRWATEVRSPQPGPAVVEPELTRRCGVPDAAIAAAAQALAEDHARGTGELDSARVAFELRVAGAPYAWPRVWSLTFTLLDPDTVTPPFERWLESFGDGGERRCGLGLAVAADGDRHLIAIAADVLADLAPLPVRSRTGAWLRLSADLLVPATAAKVVLLGPRGRPRPVPTNLTDGQAGASFALAEPGQWLVQLLIDTTTGPRPVVEALIHADVDPPNTYVALAAPGETAGDTERQPVRALEAMINAARRSEGLRGLGVDRELAAVAEAHAHAMRAARTLGHDVGDGDLPARLAAADVKVRVGGENVARASSLARAHRTLWQSPSHRETLLDDRYLVMGVGLAEDSDGSLWVCEVFAER